MCMCINSGQRALLLQLTAKKLTPGFPHSPNLGWPEPISSQNCLSFLILHPRLPDWTGSGDKTGLERPGSHWPAQPQHERPRALWTRAHVSTMSLGAGHRAPRPRPSSGLLLLGLLLLSAAVALAGGESLSRAGGHRGGGESGSPSGCNTRYALLGSC